VAWVERATLATARRLIVKIGSALLVDAAGHVRRVWLAAVVEDLAACRARGTEVLLVSSGAIAVGRNDLGLAAGALRLEEKQAAAATGQIRLGHAYFEALGQHGITVAQILLTPEDTEDRERHLNARTTLETLLGLGAIPVINENDTVATAEIRFGDNDRLAALVAHVSRATALILLSDVDGLYDGDPRKGGASRVDIVTGPHDLAAVRAGKAGTSGVGRGGMSTKVDSALIATAAGIPTVVTSAASAASAIAGERTGTYFAPTGQRQSTRLLWLAHAAVARGALKLDQGAVDAVTVRRASLLPAGITGVAGTFEAGDPVELTDEQGKPVARGIVSYDAKELPSLMGRSTRWLSSKLGPEYEREVIHRDDLVIL
jgi:glutamate 5-kinase